MISETKLLVQQESEFLTVLKYVNMQFRSVVLSLKEGNGHPTSHGAEETVQPLLPGRERLEEERSLNQETKREAIGWETGRRRWGNGRKLLSRNQESLAVLGYLNNPTTAFLPSLLPPHVFVIFSGTYIVKQKITSALRSEV